MSASRESEQSCSDLFSRGNFFDNCRFISGKMEEYGSFSSSEAVSEIVGTILLISLVITAASIVAVLVLSQPHPEDIPRINAFAENRSSTIYIIHTGGDSVPERSMRVLVNGIDSPFSLEGDATWPWSTGKILEIPYTGPGMPEYVQVIYTGGSATAVIFQASFVSQTT